MAHFVFLFELQQTLKQFFLLTGKQFRLKDSEDCSRLIAEDLDPDGRVSSLQVSNKLKQLGLISAPRKRIRHVGDTSAFNPDKLEDGNDPEKGSLSRSK